MIDAVVSIKLIMLEKILEIHKIILANRTAGVSEIPEAVGISNERVEKLRRKFGYDKPVS